MVDDVLKTMTAPRRRAFRWAAAWLAAALAAPVGQGLAGTSEQVVADPHNGLAISGYDPVGYFSDGGPSLGRADFEYDSGGAVWRFRNAGNRAAFAADPAVYTPQFGGYDPVGIVRGTPLAGDPRFWLVQGQRLYLFYSEDNRQAFVREPERFATDSRRAWPAVRKTLSP